MYDWTDFDSVLSPKTDYALDSKAVESIERERSELGGTLFFDRIWNSIGNKQAQKVYPPRTNNDLRNLWQKVVKSEVDDEKKQAVLLYVLRDCKIQNAEAKFARQTFLPLRYRLLINGLWELDHGHFSRGLEFLTDPTLTLEFADDILLTLMTSSKCDNSLAMAYYLTVSPPLAKTETLDAYFDLLLHTSIVEAYHFAQKQPATRHRELLELVLSSVLEEESSERKAERLTALLGLPYTSEEGRWFEQYLRQGAGARLPGARDTIIMRRISTGQTLDDVSISDRRGGSRMAAWATSAFPHSSTV